MRSILCFLSIIVFSSLVSSCSDQNTKTTLTLAHTLDTKHVVHIALEHFAERVEHYSNGQLDVSIYAGGQLGSERELIELLQIGSLAMTKVSASPLESFVPEMQIFSIPYLFRDREHYWQVLESELGANVLASTKPFHLVGLGYFDAGSRSFYTTYGPVNSPTDFNGKKIRVLNSPTSVATVNALGGAATPIDWGELYAALQQGVVDGAENNPPSFFLSRHYEIARYYSLDEHTFIPDVILISEHIWSSLTEQQQHWVNMAMTDAVTLQKSLWEDASNTALKAVIEDGVEVVYPDKTLFQDQVDSFHESFDDPLIVEMMKTIKNTQGQQ